MLPGTPDLDRGPGGSPKTFSDPESTFSLPTMHFSKVVFPQPDGPTKKNVSVFTTSIMDRQLLCQKNRQKISLMKTYTGVSREMILQK